MFLFITVIGLALASCKLRNPDTVLLAEPSNEFEIMNAEYENFKRLARQSPAVQGFNLDPSMQARYFRNLNPDRTDPRKFIEANFGPSDYMTNQNIIMFEGHGFREEELLQFVEAYTNGKVITTSTDDDMLFGYGVDDAKFQQILKGSSEAKPQDSTSGFSNWNVDGLVHGGFGSSYDAISFLYKEVRGRLTRLRVSGKRATDLDFEVYALPDKTAFKMAIGKSDVSGLDEYHLFVRFLRDQKSARLAPVLASLKTPHLAEEQATWSRMQENRPAQALQTYSMNDLLAFVPPPDFAFIIPDLHNQKFPHRLVEQQLGATPKKWDWIAIEAPLDCQSEIDSKKIEEYGCVNDVFEATIYDRAWSTVGAMKFFRPSSEHHLKILLDAAIKNSIKIYFIDAKINYKRGWPGSDLLGFKTRNFIFANRTPKSGRGLIFGGLWHFNDSKDNVQDFLATKTSPDNIGILEL